MNYQAVGMRTKTIYVTGTYPECIRQVNEQISIGASNIRTNTVVRHREPIRIVPEGETVLSEAEIIEQTQKEILLLELKHKQLAAEEKEKEKNSRKAVLPNGIAWTEVQEQFIINLADTHTTQQICYELNARFDVPRSFESVKKKIYFMRKAGTLPNKQVNFKWTPERTQFLIDNYRSMKKKDIAKLFGSSDQAVYDKLQQLRKKGVVK